MTLGEFFADYQGKHPLGAKEANTRYTEDIHIQHLLRLLGNDCAVRGVTTQTLQGYIDQRSQESGRRGEPLSHVTVKKEIGTFTSVWNKWGVPQGHVVGPAPTKGLVYRKIKAKPPFQTWEQIERQIARGRLTETGKADMWESLFLSLAEVQELLADVRGAVRHQTDFAMFCMAAFTGARRSEMLRSLVDDFDFEAGTVVIREKKRDRSKELTFRTVPMTPALRVAMQDWLRAHPGGTFTFCKKPDQPIKVQEAAEAFRFAVDKSKWKVLRGWHVLRHSFCSNCALKGLDQRIIDSWMGHQTEEMRRRYRHLFPNQQQEAIRAVFW